MSLLNKWIARAFMCLLFWVGGLQAEPQKTVVALLSGDSDPYFDVVSGIQSVLDQSSANITLKAVTLDQIRQEGPLQPAGIDLVVSVGTRATEYALTNVPSSSVFSTFVTRSSLLSVVAESGVVPPALPAHLRRAVVLDQPAERIISLVKFIAPDVRQLGTVVNASEPNRLGEFEKAIEKEGLQLEAAELLSDSNPIKDLKRVFSVSDVFVVIPDKSSFNSKVAKWILFLSYRHRIPVIGYSQKYTDAGALASIYTTPFQIGQDTGEQLVEMLFAGNSDLAGGVVRYPRYFKLTFNDTVADSLGIRVGDKQVIKQSITEMEPGKDEGMGNE